jgi:diguanylate cyclase (GGDEF)-like protein/putative nucleotidyltransferase with HDIG domain
MRSTDLSQQVYRGLRAALFSLIITISAIEVVERLVHGGSVPFQTLLACVVFVALAATLKRSPNLPVNIYVRAVIFAGSLLLIFKSTTLFERVVHGGPVYQVLFFCMIIFVAITATIKVKIIPGSEYGDDTAKMSVAFVGVFVTLMSLGPEAAMVCGVVSAISAGLYPVPMKAIQFFFNVAALSLTAWTAGAVFLALNGALWLTSGARSGVAVIAATLTYYCINVILVATIFSLLQKRSLIEIWRSQYLWLLPAIAAGASTAFLAVYLLHSHNFILIIVCLPVLVLVFYSYQIYVDKIEQKEKHIEELQEKQAQLAELYLSTVKSLAMAIDAKDQHTHEHILRVQRYALATAEAMQLSVEDIDAVRTGSLLHDIGKLGVPEYVLLKPGRLTADEFDKIKRHPTIGADILSPVNFSNDVIAIVKFHHEKWDGTGYPDGLAGEQIPRVARILAVADVFDALTSSRSYRRAWLRDQAKEHIRSSSGTHFDPEIVEYFFQIVDEVADDIDVEQKSRLKLQGPGSLLETNSSGLARAAKRIHRANAELWALYETTQMLGTGMGAVDTVQVLAGKIAEAFACSVCYFLLKNSDGTFSVPRAVGINEEYFRNAKFVGELGKGFIGKVLQSGKIMRAEYEGDELLLTGSNTPWQELRDGLAVPLYHEGDMLGTVVLCHEHAGYFTEDDMHFLQIVALHAAAAMYNALLLDRTRTDAYTDPLTGLSNVRAFMNNVEDWMRSSLALTDGNEVAVLFIDLDNFKPINDNFGHQQGDALLKEIAKVLRKHIRPQDKAIRYGGDEFLIVLPGSDSQTAEAVAARLEQAIADEVDGLHHPVYGEVKVGASIGIASYPRDGTDFPLLLSAADQRMYQRKTQRKLKLLGREGSSVPPESPATLLKLI